MPTRLGVNNYSAARLKRKHIPTILLALLIVILLLLPQFVGHFAIYLMIHILLLSLFALSVNLLLGYTGLLSFGQAGFYAIGAYACAKILLAWPSLLPGVIGGVLLAGIVAVILGFLCVRHTKIYFVMLTLSFGMMIFAILIRWRAVTGGDDGLVGIPRAPLEIPGIFSLDMGPMANYYYFVLIVALVAIFIFYRIVNSPFGLVLQGIRDSESRVAFAAISVRNYRLIGFTVAGLYAGLAGALLAPLEMVVTPTIAHFAQGFLPIFASLLGGIYTFAGPLIGAFLLIVMRDIIIRFTEYWMMALGIAMLALVLGLRGGVVSVAQEKLFPWLRQRFGEGA